MWQRLHSYHPGQLYKCLNDRPWETLELFPFSGLLLRRLSLHLASFNHLLNASSQMVKSESLKAFCSVPCLEGENRKIVIWVVTQRFSNPIKTDTLPSKTSYRWRERNPMRFSLPPPSRFILWASSSDKVGEDIAGASSLGIHYLFLYITWHVINLQHKINMLMNGNWSNDSRKRQNIYLQQQQY